LGWSFTFGESQMIPSYSGTSYWFKVRDEFSRNYFRWKGHAKAVVTDKGDYWLRNCWLDSRCFLMLISKTLVLN
jgi:hypothetical protein